MSSVLPQSPKRMPSTRRMGSERRRASPVGHTAPSRTCIGCRRSDQQENLLRIVGTPEGKIAFDLGGGTFGRGAWVHPRPECLTKSTKALAHAFRAAFAVTAREMLDCLSTTALRRAESLVRAAKRAGHLQIGSDAGGDAWARGKVALVVLAEDARAAIDLPWVRSAQAAGKALVGPSKTTLGNWCELELVAVVAITDAGLAKAINRSMALARMPSPAESRRDDDRGTEVG